VGGIAVSRLLSPELRVLKCRPPLCTLCTRFYATDNELKRLFNSVNGLVFPVSELLELADTRRANLAPAVGRFICRLNMQPP
jgi:hypothetical protein